MKLLEKIKKNSVIKETELLTKSVYMNDVDMTPTSIPGLNIALSGELDGGMQSGILTIAGPSKHFKTMYAMIMAASYMKKYPEAVLLFYDSEFGSPLQYFKSAGIDMTRVVHTPIKNLEDLKFDITKQLDGIERGDKVFILIDSVGNLASVKEADDALEGKSTADMSRAKYSKGIYRIITPHLRLKDIPLVQISHVYMEQGAMYPKAIVGGGTGITYSSDNVWIVSRSQEKDGTELLGYKFTINVEKSRHLRERSRIPIVVNFENGISKYSGLLDIAMELNYVIKPSNGWYSRVLDGGEVEAKKWRVKDTDSAEFWDPLLNSQDFKDAVKAKFKLGQSDEDISDEHISTEIGE